MRGKITTIFPPNINTDDIIRADVLQEHWEKDKFAQFAFEKFDEEFVNRCNTSEANIVIAGSNFGCGSSREQAVYALQFNNVKFMITEINKTSGEAYPDIFYRNSVLNGFVCVALEDISGFDYDDELELQLKEQKVINHTKNKTYNFDIKETDLNILLGGGLVGMAKADIEKRLANS
ncbi:MAG: 3-isopropylmalate dehydratase small subunit [uncultured Campylobacterales bacterium]|uniref:3-isopropylmalate dehydratase small subunit n=1 Tax=uncultured Campylobacterales bacterium TaxID=352960 RepID=A0A6S6SC59_9BACT|nr:MAG: 3-isopropylmalate dehydratase small subunit [uncultured Campylobacterales bacterium]